MTDAPISHTQPALRDLPPRTFLAIDGEGRPQGARFQAAVAALYPTPREDVSLEGSYWSLDDPLSFDLGRPDQWRWTLRVPVDVGAARPPDVARVEQRPAERVAYLTHHGPYEAEGPSLDALYAFVAISGLEPIGPHVEVYLTDPRVVAPADLRTELRVAVR